MTEKFVPVPTDPLTLTDRDLRALLGGLKDSELMRSLIMAEVVQVRQGADRETRTMRSVWYDHIKPVLSRLGVLNQKTRNGEAVDWPTKLSAYLAEIVRDGLTTYEELLIIDGSRQRQVAYEILVPVQNVPVVGAHFPWLILFTEKDTIWPVVEALASLYGVSAISGGGEPSLACTENTVLEILRSEAYEVGQALVLLSLTDYDPAGYSIAVSQYQQLLDTAHGVTVVHERLGLTPEQLTPDERAAKAYEPKEKGLAKWYAETGGVDGQPLGLELDALRLSRLRAMFAEAIENHIDLDKRRNDLRESFLELLVWEELEAMIAAKRQDMIDAVEAAGLWQRIQQTPIPAGLFRGAAVEGWNRINPVTTRYARAPIFDCGEEVRAAMRAVLP